MVEAVEVRAALGRPIEVEASYFGGVGSRKKARRISAKPISGITTDDSSAVIAAAGVAGAVAVAIACMAQRASKLIGDRVQIRGTGKAL